MKRNCKRMLDAVGELGWELRLGVTGHKVSGADLISRDFLRDGLFNSVWLRE